MKHALIVTGCVVAVVMGVFAFAGPSTTAPGRRAVRPATVDPVTGIIIPAQPPSGW